MRRWVPAGGLLLAFAAMAAAQVRISGVVSEQAGSTPSPVPGASVLAHAGTPPRAVAQAETDSQGRYTLSDLPAGRVSLSVVAQGYYTVRAGGVESDSIARSCPQEGDCGETSFEVARTAVVEGWLTDSYGDPYQDVLLELRPETGPNTGLGDPMRFSGMRATSDDRGYFRIWGVKPGRYELTMREQGVGTPLVELQKQSIEIAPGQTESQTRITVKTDSNVFSISGEVVGVEADDLRRTGVAIQEAGDGSPAYWTRYESLRDGKFTISGLREGRYVLKLANFTGEERQWSYLETLNVDKDLTGLVLTPKPPTGVRGRVEFVDGDPSDLYFSVGPPGHRGYTRERLEAKGPEYEFEHAGLAPGEYEIALRDQGFYLIDRALATVRIGSMEELTLRVSNVRSTVRGAVRVMEAEGRAAAAHYTVVMRSDRARYKIQTDDSGGFAFLNVIPDEYEIAAFALADVDVDDNQAWESARERRKRLTLEAGFETEVDLTVTR